MATKPASVAAAEAPFTATATPAARLTALDALRGATIALMIIVNNPGGPISYGPLNHSAWNGWTLTDTVFPTFLWIVGVSITLSLAKRMASGASRRELISQVFRRSVIIFLIGVAIYVAPRFDLSTQRIMGVLQRIAICYLIASLIYLYTGVRGQIAWIVGLLAAYWFLMAFVPVPGFGAGRLDVEGNFAHYIDRIVFGSHNYAETKTWDPEGIVSTLPAIATALFGVMAGHILRLKQVLSERTTWLFLTGNALIGLGLICDVWLPINKKLWTDSFALFMAGLDFVLLAALIWMIDHLGFRRGVKPLTVLGMNAIVLYMAAEFGAEILDMIRISSNGRPISLQMWLYQTIFSPLASPINASLLYSIVFLAVIYLIGYTMYRRKWFVRV